jgi:hypothetical protein
LRHFEACVVEKERYFVAQASRVAPVKKQATHRGRRTLFNDTPQTRPRWTYT